MRALPRSTLASLFVLALSVATARADQKTADAAVDAGSEADASTTSDSTNGGTIVIKSNPDDRVSVGGPVTVTEQESVGDAVAVGGSVTVMGHTRGDAVSIGGPLHAGPHAVIDGDAVVIGGSLDADDGAVIKGKRVVVGSLVGLGGIAGLVGAIGTFAAIWMVVSAVVSILGLIALGALFVAFIPERLDRMKEVLVARPLPAFGVGLAAFVGIVPATIVLVVSIIGILLIPFLWMAFGLVIALGLAIVAQHIGDRLLRGTKFAGPLPALAAGALLLTLVRLVPFIGALAFLFVMIWGSGAALLTRLGAPRQDVQPPPALPREDPLMPPSAEG